MISSSDYPEKIKKRVNDYFPFEEDLQMIDEFIKNDLSPQSKEKKLPSNSTADEEEIQKIISFLKDSSDSSMVNEGSRDMRVCPESRQMKKKVITKRKNAEQRKQTERTKMVPRTASKTVRLKIDRVIIFFFLRLDP